MPGSYCRESGHNVRTCRERREITFPVNLSVERERREREEREIRNQTLLNSQLILLQGIRDRIRREREERERMERENNRIQMININDFHSEEYLILNNIYKLRYEKDNVTDKEYREHLYFIKDNNRGIFDMNKMIGLSNLINILKDKNNKINAIIGFFEIFIRNYTNMQKHRDFMLQKLLYIGEEFYDNKIRSNRFDIILDFIECDIDKKNIKCPLCRQYSIIDIKNVKEIEEECCVCMENKASILLNKCNHKCLCRGCAIKI